MGRSTDSHHISLVASFSDVERFYTQLTAGCILASGRSVSGGPEFDRSFIGSVRSVYLVIWIDECSHMQFPDGHVSSKKNTLAWVDIDHYRMGIFYGVLVK